MKKNVNLRKIIPIIHFLLTFLFERFVFVFEGYGDIVTPVAKSDLISLAGERAMGYIIAKLLAGVFVLCLWKLIFYITDNINKGFVKGFLAFGVAGLAVILICFPNCFGYGVYGEYSDNLITFSYALRFLPEYWHSAYSSLIYAASMEVIPSPVAIPVIQWTFLVFDLAYVFSRVTTELKAEGLRKCSVILIFLLPESWLLGTYAYRTEGFAILCMFFFSLVLIDCVAGKVRSAKSLIGLCILAGFISVWRTEGVILGVLAIVVLLINNRSLGLKKIIAYGVVFAASFLLIAIPQKIGDMKYYGSDYTIINSFSGLRNIFNREDSDLSYAGAEEDIEAIEAVVPVEAIRLLGLEGYRDYNVLMGHRDINQSIPDMEAGKAYSAAYRRLCLHNIKAYALTQIGKLKEALKLTDREYIEKIHGPFTLSREYPDYSFPAWEWGEEDLLSFRHVEIWADNPLRKAAGTGIISAVRGVEGLARRLYISFFILACLIVTAGICLVYDFIAILRKKNEQRKYISFFAVNLILFMEAAAIFLVMPAGVLSYFRAVLTCMFLVLYIRSNALHKGSDVKETLG